MNQLNSVLLEGTVTDEPDFGRSVPGGAVACTFHVESVRFQKRGDTVEKEVNTFEIQTFDDLAAACGALTKGRGVRVVGRLKQLTENYDLASRVVLVAEHVELKPILRQESED